ncbi:NIPSNAP family protein [Marinomonas epiphytica]
MAIVELREYKVLPGKLEAWLTWMAEEILPYQVSKGMRVLNTYTHQDEDGQDWFVWLREFDSESERQRLYEETYNDWWVSEIRPKVFQHIDQKAIRVRVLQAC